MSSNNERAESQRESTVHTAVAAALLIAGAYLSAGPLAQLASEGFLAAYPAWFAESLAYVTALALLGLLMQGGIKKCDAALLAAAFAVPIFVGALNVMNSITPRPGSAHSAVMEVSPNMHAMIFYVVVAIVFVKGAAAFVTRLKASQKISK